MGFDLDKSPIHWDIAGASCWNVVLKKKAAMDTAPPAPLPRIVALLGYGGLLPFLALVGACLLGGFHTAFWRQALFAYGAVILSFVGALHWGFAMFLPGLDERQRAWRYAWSVVPALLAWPAVLLSPRMASALLVWGFAMHYLQDRRLARRVALPAWYLPLRLRLTSIACLCLAGGGLITVHERADYVSWLRALLA